MAFMGLRLSRGVAGPSDGNTGSCSKYGTPGARRKLQCQGPRGVSWGSGVMCWAESSQEDGVRVVYHVATV